MRYGKANSIVIILYKHIPMNSLKIIFILLFVLSACKPSADELLEKELQRHILLQDDNANVIPVGKTVCFEKGIREGIDRSRYPAPELQIDIDTTFFLYIGNKTFSNPDEAGGISTTLEIYRAKHPGKTEIKTYEVQYVAGKNNENRFDTITQQTGLFTINITQ